MVGRQRWGLTGRAVAQQPLAIEARGADNFDRALASLVALVRDEGTLLAAQGLRRYGFHGQLADLKARWHPDQKLTLATSGSAASLGSDPWECGVDLRGAAVRPTAGADRCAFRCGARAPQDHGKPVQLREVRRLHSFTARHGPSRTPCAVQTLTT
jgi:hypothetical protein